jgi:hypothetical protein
MPGPRVARLLLRHLPYLLAVAAVALAAVAFFEHRYAAHLQDDLLPLMRASARWPAAPGRVVESGVEEVERGRFSHSPTVHYKARVRYRYRVDGRAYENDRICYDVANCGTGTGREAAAALAADYPEGAAVRVRHDPAHPERAVLRTGVQRPVQADIAHHRGKARAAGAGAAATAGLALLIFAWARLRRPPEERVEERVQ